MNSNKGFTLIELVIAIFILVVAIIGVYNAFSTIVIMTTDSSSRFTAAYLAQDGMEIIRNIRDNNWVKNTTTKTDWKTGLTGCEAGCEADYKTGTSQEITPLRGYLGGGNYLKINNDDGFYSYDEPTEGYTTTKFKRKITITPNADPDVLNVSVLVTWNEKGEEGCDVSKGIGNCIEVEEKLYDWYQ